MSGPQLSHGAMRSSARRLLLSVSHRPRNYALRFLAVALVTLALTALAAAVAGQSLPKSFPFVLLYLAHDQLWLVLQGHLWTAQFPYSLVWALPLLTVVAVLVTEGLTPYGVRWLHRRFLLFLMRRGIDPLRRRLPEDVALVRRWQDLALDDHTGWGGFALRVAIEQRHACWHSLRQATLAGQPLTEGQRLMLVRSTQWWLWLDPTGPRAVLAALEAIALCSPSVTGDLIRMVEKTLAPSTVIDADLAIVRAALGVLTSAGSGQGPALALVAAMQRLSALDGHTRPASRPGPAALAADAILLGVTAETSATVMARDWFSLLARLRLSDRIRAQAPEVASSISVVMELCDFSFWAFLAERAALRHEKLSDPLLSDWASPATSAEHFAREGTLP